MASKTYDDGGIMQGLQLINNLKETEKQKNPYTIRDLVQEKKIRIKFVKDLQDDANGRVEWGEGKDIVHKIPVYDKDGKIVKDKDGNVVTKEFKTRVGDEIQINERFRNCPIAIASAITHEVQHIINYEQNANGLLHNLLLHSPQEEFLCNLKAGEMLWRLGVKRVNYVPENDIEGLFIKQHEEDWGTAWNQVLSSNIQKNKIESFIIWNHFKNYFNGNKKVFAKLGITNPDELFDNTFKEKSKENFDIVWTNFFKWYSQNKEKAVKEKGWDNEYFHVDILNYSDKFRDFFGQYRGKASRCGRPCKDPKLTPCDIRSFFGPCHWHVGQSWITEQEYKP